MFVFTSYKNNLKLKKEPQSRVTRDGPRDALGRGSGCLVPSSCHTTTHTKKEMLTSLKKLKFPTIPLLWYILCKETLLYNVIHKSKHMAVIFIFSEVFLMI